jgi:hypothetical protein
MTSAMTNTNTAKRKPVAMNGVNKPALLATINAVGAQPELAKFQFRATYHWISGGSRRRLKGISKMEAPLIDLTSDLRSAIVGRR